MLKPPMPNVAGVTDTLDFVKNLWGSMNVPGIGAMGGPALSTDELDKKIADLKAVESWLNLNANMLRATIQALEVQRGTIATLKSMGESMAQAMGQQGADGKAAAPFQFFAQPGAGAAPAGAQAQQSAQPQQPTGAAPAQEVPPAMPAAVAWWNLLQEQFKQAVASTMSPEAVAQATAMAQDAAARFGVPGTDGKPAAPANEEQPAAKPRNGKPKPDKA